MRHCTSIVPPAPPASLPHCCTPSIAKHRREGGGGRVAQVSRREPQKRWQRAAGFGDMTTSIISKLLRSLQALIRIDTSPASSQGSVSNYEQVTCVDHVQGMQIVVLALIRSIPPISSVAMFGLFEFIIFAIIGIQLFSGRLGACNQVVSALLKLSPAFPPPSPPPPRY